MNIAEIAICLLILIPEASGLDFTLDIAPPAAHGTRSVCGVLTCEEQAARTNPSHSQPTPPRTILGMNIFKHARNGENGGNGETQILVASLTLERSRISRVSDGVKVDGDLEAGRATLKLEMTKEDDCSAQYSCEVRTSDNQGNELLHRNRFRHGLKRQEGPVSDGVMTAGTLQQLALLQQQVTLLGASLEGKLGGFREKLEALDDKVTATDSRLESAQNRLEDKIESVKDDMSSQIETRVMDKLCQLEVKLPDTSLSVAVDGSGTWGKVEKQLLDWQGEQQKVAALNTIAISNSTAEIVSALERHAAEIFARDQRDYLRYENFTAAMQNMLETGNEACGQEQSDISSIFNKLQMDLESLGRIVKNRSEETFFAIGDLPGIVNSSIVTNLQRAVKDLLSPQACTRVMMAVSGDARYPYPVIRPSAHSGLTVPYLCDTVTQGGGWIIIQRRTTGTVNFYRDWKAYKEGFGQLDNDFWLGNEKVHRLTKSGQFELRIDLKYKGKFRFAHYDLFSLEDESQSYTLRLGQYDGTAGDDLSYHKGRPFSTYDRDHDELSYNCATVCSGAWWYGACYHSNLNGEWAVSSDKGMRWTKFSVENSVMFSEMKIRKL